MKPWPFILKSAPPLYITDLWIIITSLHPPTLLAVQNPDMHLFMGSRLPWEWNIATWGHVYELAVFMGSTHINVVLLHTQKVYYYSHYSQPLAHIHIVHRWEIVGQWSRPSVQVVVSFVLIDAFNLPATSFEGLELVVRRKSVSFQTFIYEFSIVLERCATHQTDCVILGGCNVHYDDGTTSNTRKLTEFLQEADFKQHVREQTHVDDHILDLVITRNSHNIISSTSVETLLTDHHVIRCGLVTRKTKTTEKADQI